MENEHSWEADMKIISGINVIVPVKLYLVCNHIAGKVGNNEFSIVTEIQEKDSENILLSESFYIPKQRVTPGNIDYLPDSYKEKVVIHRHPNGCDGFSSTDRDFINENFELSLLYTKRDGFVNGIYNMRLDEKTLIQLPVDITVDYNIEEVNLDNIIESKSLFDEMELKTFKPAEIKSGRNNEQDTMENRLDMLEEMVYYNNRYDIGNF